MADPLSIASGIAGLLSLTIEITKLSCNYISDIRSAHSTQKQYLREISALTDVLLRSEEAAQAFESQVLSTSRPTHLSKDVIDDCAKTLGQLLADLSKPTPTIFWPIKEGPLKKRIEDLQRFRSIFSSFLTAQTLVTVSATHDKVTKLGKHQERDDLLEWIGNPKDTSKPAPPPFLDTGKWFLESDGFQAWVKGSGSSAQLWCHGPPGVGKSMLASVALQYLVENIEDDSLVVARYFCDISNRREQTKEAIWKSILSQVITQSRGPVLQTIASFRAQQASIRSATLKDLSGAVLNLCLNQQVIIVFDGIDELDSSMVMKAILGPIVKSNGRIMALSRDLPDIRSTLTMASVVEIEADQGDLNTYINSEFEANDMEDLLVEHPELAKGVMERSNGM
jgi:hypothetical protein